MTLVYDHFSATATIPIVVYGGGVKKYLTIFFIFINKNGNNLNIFMKFGIDILINIIYYRVKKKVEKVL